MEPVPTVGRIVHYVAFGTPGGEYPSGVCRAAIVTRVHDPENPDTDLSLCILNPTGMFFNERVEPGREAGQWHWPERA
jgi:hypothetical protein